MLVLDNQRIDIWFFPLTNWLDQAQYFISKDELDRANQFYFKIHCQRFIMARATLRCIISKYIDCSPQEIKFEYLEQGKPYIQNSQLLEFNLSHSEDWGIIAIGRAFPLGVDIEHYSPRPYVGIAKQVFSDTEITVLKNLPKYLQPNYFFSVWSLKEAFIKACGLGLSYPTTEFSVNGLTQHMQIVWDHKYQKTRKLYKFMPRVNCSGALCCEEHIHTLKYHYLLPANLFFNCGLKC